MTQLPLFDSDMLYACQSFVYLEKTQMRYHKLKAGECPDTYVVTELVTEQKLLHMANHIARKHLVKGSAVR